MMLIEKIDDRYEMVAKCPHAEINTSHIFEECSMKVCINCQARREQSQSLDICEMQMDKLKCPEDAGVEGRKGVCATYRRR